MNPDLKIAQSKIPKKIDVIADSLGISKEDLEHYGHYKAKIPVHLIDEEQGKSIEINSRYGHYANSSR